MKHQQTSWSYQHEERSDEAPAYFHEYPGSLSQHQLYVVAESFHACVTNQRIVYSQCFHALDTQQVNLDQRILINPAITYMDSSF